MYHLSGSMLPSLLYGFLPTIHTHTHTPHHGDDIIRQAVGHTSFNTYKTRRASTISTQTVRSTVVEESKRVPESVDCRIKFIRLPQHDTLVVCLSHSSGCVKDDVQFRCFRPKIEVPFLVQLNSYQSKISIASCVCTALGTCILHLKLRTELRVFLSY